MKPMLFVGGGSRTHQTVRSLHGDWQNPTGVEHRVDRTGFHDRVVWRWERLGRITCDPSHAHHFHTPTFGRSSGDLSCNWGNQLHGRDGSLIERRGSDIYRDQRHPNHGHGSCRGNNWKGVGHDTQGKCKLAQQLHRNRTCTGADHHWLQSEQWTSRNGGDCHWHQPDGRHRLIAKWHPNYFYREQCYADHHHSSGGRHHGNNLGDHSGWKRDFGKRVYCDHFKFHARPFDLRALHYAGDA